MSNVVLFVLAGTCKIGLCSRPAALEPSHSSQPAARFCVLTRGWKTQCKMKLSEEKSHTCVGLSIHGPIPGYAVCIGFVCGK